MPEVVAAVERMERCRSLDVPLAQAALAFNYTEPLVDVTVPGMVSVREIEENVCAFDVALTREQLDSIAEAGRIDPALLGGPEFLSAWPADRRPTREQLQARWPSAAATGKGPQEVDQQPVDVLGVPLSRRRTRHGRGPAPLGAEPEARRGARRLWPLDPAANAIRLDESMPDFHRLITG